jgi:hypothetical protein
VVLYPEFCRSRAIFAQIEIFSGNQAQPCIEIANIDFLQITKIWANGAESNRLHEHYSPANVLTMVLFPCGVLFEKFFLPVFQQ